MDEHGWVIGCETTSGSMNDNNAAMGFLDNIKAEHPKITAAVMDAGYTSPILLDLLLNKGVAPVVPYAKPKGKKLKNETTQETETRLSKQDFKYQEDGNYFVCPWLKKLMYKGINKDGYREFKTSKKDCRNCPFKHKCTNSDIKTLTIHMLEYTKAIVREIRLSEFGKELYPKRKYTIERAFALGKISNCRGVLAGSGTRKTKTGTTSCSRRPTLRSWLFWFGNPAKDSSVSAPSFKQFSTKFSSESTKTKTRSSESS
ncbi:MAG: transposase [Bacillus subtilis]|nr:transposase [Bacillus subtilis]